MFFVNDKSSILLQGQGELVAPVAINKPAFDRLRLTAQEFVGESFKIIAISAIKTVFNNAKKYCNG